MNSNRSTTISNANDRLGFTLFTAFMLHTMVILGISFTAYVAKEGQQQKPLDIVIANTRSLEEPEDAKNIAQFNQQASGSADTPDRPSNPLAAMLPAEQPGQAPVPVEQQEQSAQQEKEARVITAPESSIRTPSSKDSDDQVAEDSQTEEQRQQREMEMAQLAAEIELADKRYAERPRVHFVDALSAKSAVEAMYVNDWVRRVENMGNLNYPESALQGKIGGRLTLSVRLDQQGEIVLIDIDHSSGSTMLDNAARDIVRLAAPYMAFPEEMRAKYDQLDITRTWVFHSGASSLN